MNDLNALSHCFKSLKTFDDKEVEIELFRDGTKWKSLNIIKQSFSYTRFLHLNLKEKLIELSKVKIFLLSQFVKYIFIYIILLYIFSNKN